MAFVLFLVAAFFFFLGGVGAALIPNPVTWGLVLLALGLAVGSYPPRWKAAP